MTKIQDALLADLKLDSQPVKSHESHRYQHTYTSDGRTMTERDSHRYNSSGSPVPPPVPPPPSQDALQVLHNDRMMHGWNTGQKIYSSSILISKTEYDINGERTSESSEKHFYTDGRQYSNEPYDRASPRPGAGQSSRPVSNLSNNLDQLDNLLDDLNTTQQRYSPANTGPRKSPNIRNGSYVPPSRSPGPDYTSTNGTQRDMEIPVLQNLVSSKPYANTYDEIPARHSPSMSWQRPPSQQHSLDRRSPGIRGGQSPVNYSRSSPPTVQRGYSPAQHQRSPYGSSPQPLGYQVVEETVTKEQRSMLPQSAPRQQLPQHEDDKTDACNELGELLASIASQDDTLIRHVGEPPYAQPAKLRQGYQHPNQSPMNAGRDETDAAPLRPGSRGDVNTLSTSGSLNRSRISPSPHDASFSPGSSVGGQRMPMPSLVHDQGSKAVVTRGMHGRQIMIGDQLVTDWSELGIDSLQRGCAGCGQMIEGQVLIAMGKIWHIDHFNCAHCSRRLGTDIFYVIDDLPYCQRDYYELFAQKCAYCNEAILDVCINAMSAAWHPEHFVCNSCGKQLDDFFDKDGKPYCRDDYFRLFAEYCAGCDNPILGGYYKALRRKWHPECFMCYECHSTFDSGYFYDERGIPYCEKHLPSLRAGICATCRQPIVGPCVTAKFKKYHPEHFVCSFCQHQLKQGTFKDQGEKPYCNGCFVKLFS